MSFKDKFIDIVNSWLPGNKQIVDYQELSTAFNKALGDALSERKTKEDNPTDYNPDNFVRHNISVASASARKYISDNQWFNNKDIDIKEAGVRIKYENTYREMTPEQIRLAQDACFKRMQTDPLFGSAIFHWMNYTIGTGVKTDTQINDINEVFDKFNKINNFDEEVSLEEAVVFRVFLDGECFILVTVDSVNGDCYVNFLEPYEITDWEYHPKNRKIILSYKVDNQGETEWVADANYFDVVQKNKLWKTSSTHENELSKERFIIHIKRNMYGEFRGRPLGLPALKYFKYAEDFMYDRIILNHERSRVLWIRKISGRAASNLANYMAAPPGGVMLNETEDISYRVEKAEINAGDVKEDYLSILYLIASSFQMPIHVFNMRANEQVYASVTSAKAPFTKAIQTHQSFFDRAFNKIHKVIIREKVKASQLKSKYSISFISNGKKITKTVDAIDVPIVHAFPNPIDEKLSERTAHEKFLIEDKVSSIRTIQELNGLDPDIEKERIDNEDELWTSMMSVKKSNSNQDPTGVGTGGGNNPRNK
jgi:hypothetical protein